MVQHMQLVNKYVLAVASKEAKASIWIIPLDESFKGNAEGEICRRLAASCKSRLFFSSSSFNTSRTGFRFRICISW